MDAEHPCDNVCGWNAFIKPDAQADAGTLQYHAEINSSTSGDNITFTCNLNQTVDGQQTSYQWQENKGNGWQDISGATGASYTVNKAGRGGYQYRCKVTIVVNNSYSLMNECYKAFYTDRELRPNFSIGGRICTDIHRMIIW